MGILDRIVKDIRGVPTERILEQERIEQEIRAMDMMQMQGGGYSAGQPLPPPQQVVLPPTLEKETMDLYLIPKIPERLEELKGTDQYFPFIHSATTIITGNLNAHRQKKILTKFRVARDLDGCDNVEGLVLNKMLDIMAEVETDKARSDFQDGMRERIVPALGLGMTGTWNQQHGSGGERPKESGAIRGIFQRGGQQH
jgi:hypothetical protein